MQRKPAPPIFDTDDITNVHEIISNPLPKLVPMDITVGDSDDDSSSSFEEITLNPVNKPTMENVNEFWAFIAKLGWQDKPRFTQTIRNRVEKDYAQLNPANKAAFNTHVRYFKGELNKAIERKNLYDKFARKLNYIYYERLLLHVIMRGQSFYNTIVGDPSPIGYLIGATETSDEFVIDNIFGY